MSALGPQGVARQKAYELDCIFMSLSVRDLSPEMLVLGSPTYFANAIALTPSTDVVRSMVMSACAVPAANPRTLIDPGG